MHGCHRLHVRDVLGLDGRDVTGFCFTPQDGNPLLSTAAATVWFLDPDGYEKRVQCLRDFFFDEV